MARIDFACISHAPRQVNLYASKAKGPIMEGKNGRDSRAEHGEEELLRLTCIVFDESVHMPCCESTES